MEFFGQKPEAVAEMLSSLAFNNRVAILESEECGCLCCASVFPATDVKKFKDDISGLCPQCNLVSVLPDNSGISISKKDLQGYSALICKHVIQLGNGDALFNFKGYVK